MNRIPSDDELDRAAQAVREKGQLQDAVCKSVFDHFSYLPELHKVWMFGPNLSNVIFAYVFFKTEANKQKYKDDVVVQQIKDLIEAEVERVGLAKASEFTVELELDSDENVRTNFDGSYHLRFR